MTKYVIVGSGVAGVTAAEEIRRRDPDGRITLYNGEPFPFYYRAALAFYIKGAIAEEELFGKPPAWAKTERIRILNEKVTAVQTSEKCVTGESGMAEPYDRLLIATGSWPFKAPWPGADLEGVVTYHSLMCARTTLDNIKKHNVKKAVVVGGGILGVELVEDLSNLGIETTLLVRKNRVLDLLFDVEGAKLIQDQMIEDGVDVRLNCEMAEVIGDGGRVCGVVTNTGDSIDAQLVGIAIGVRPHVEFLEGSGIEIDRGVVVDGKLMTSDDSVYAAGDAVVRRVGETLIPCRTWLTAAGQGRVAGSNMAGAEAPFEEKVFFNASHAYKSFYAVLGRFNAPETDTVRHVRLAGPEGTHGKIIMEQDRIIGGLFIGHVEPVWDVYRAIESGEAVDEAAVLAASGLRLSEALSGRPALLF